MKFFNRSLPKKGEIYEASAKPNDIGSLARRHYKSVLVFRMLGIVTIVTLLATLYSLVSQNNVNSGSTVKLAETVSQAPTQSKSKHCNNDDNCDSSNWDNSDWSSNDSWDNSDWSSNTYTASSYVAPSLYIAPAINWNDNTYTSTNTNYQPGTGIDGISNQLVGIQQNIGKQMQTCVNNARNMANQIINLKNQQKALQNRIDNLRQQENNIDTSNNSGQNRYNSLDHQIQNLQSQSDNYDNVINNAEDQYNTSNNNCQDRISQLKQNRSDAESNLDDNFNKAMDINTDINNY